MRWNKRYKGSLVPVVVVVAVLCGLWGVRAYVRADDKRLAVCAPQGNYSVIILEREGHAYVPLNEVLDPVARPEIHIEGDRVRVRAGQLEAEFREGKTKVKIGRGEAELGAKVLF